LPINYNRNAVDVRVCDTGTRRSRLSRKTLHIGAYVILFANKLYVESLP